VKAHTDRQPQERLLLRFNSGDHLHLRTEAMHPSLQGHSTFPICCTGGITPSSLAAREKPDDTANALATDRAHGHHYTGSFEMKVPEGEPTSLFTIWTGEAGTWKMVGWRLIAR